MSNSIGSPRCCSALYRSYFSINGSSELRLVTTCAMLLICRVRLSSVIVGTTELGSVEGLTTMSVDDSYRSGSCQTTHATETAIAIAGRMINHLRFQAIFAYSPGVRCRNSTL